MTKTLNYQIMVHMEIMMYSVFVNVIRNNLQKGVKKCTKLNKNI